MSTRLRFVVLAILLCGGLQVLTADAQDATSRVPATQIIRSTVRAYMVVCDVRDAPDGDPMGVPIYETCQALSAGSGTIISQQGLILTNAHVALNPETGNPQWLLIALTVDARELPVLGFFGRAIVYDRAVDLAVVKPFYLPDGTPLDEEDVNLLPLPMAQNEKAVDLEQSIRLIGYPAVGGYTITINPAVVSGFSPDQNVPELGGSAWFKTVPSGGAGISGGTAVDDNGILVGVPSAGGQSEIRCYDVDNDGENDITSECVATAGETGFSRPIPEAYDLLLQKAEQSGQLDNSGLDNSSPPSDDDAPNPPDEGVVITGRIVSADTGDPIEGAQVFVFQPGVTIDEAIDNQSGDDIYSYAETDGRGTYILNNPVARNQAYSVFVQARGYNSIGGDDIILATDVDPSTKDLGTWELASAE